MSGFALVQAAVIGMVVAFSAWQAFHKLLPQTSRRLLAGIAAALDRPGRPAAVCRLGRWLRPAEAKAGGCGDGCGSCSGCAPAKPAAADDAGQHPLRFRSRQ
ncbi:MAG: hypothetical protein KGJ97_02855 [Xanthomonadaceae bacterium]|nr:hypothetical protein [Xanthomonadaceae bacterium]MDE3071952.1 hypothetical protein [Pseudomonadota bacterium]